NGTQLDGRTLTGNEAKPMARRDNGGDAGHDGGRNRREGFRYLTSQGATGRMPLLFLHIIAGLRPALPEVEAYCRYSSVGSPADTPEFFLFRVFPAPRTLANLGDFLLGRKPRRFHDRT
ncbi:MAG: hypothetical protein ACREQ2_01625, partial [Candidatus Binatia bacterium]